MIAGTLASGKTKKQPITSKIISNCWLARCKLQATLIIARHVCVCVCVWHFLVNFSAKYLGNEAI